MSHLSLISTGHISTSLQVADIVYMHTINADWHQEINSWIDYLKAAGRAQSTLRTRSEHLSWLRRDFLAIKRPFDVTLDDLMGWASSHDWAMETRRGVRASVRGFYAWAVDTDRLEMSPADKWPRVPAVLPQPRPASESDYEIALSKVRRPRERVMLRLACEAGLRRAEVACVHVTDLFEDLGGWALWVHGKGGTLASIPLTQSLARELSALFAMNPDSGYAFPGKYGDGHLSPQWVGKLVARLLPGITTMHQLRHKFGTDVHEETGDLLVTQQLLRHATVATTQRYVRVPLAKARAAVTTVYEVRQSA